MFIYCLALFEVGLPELVGGRRTKQNLSPILA